jgi:hypothetical protein
MTRWPSLLSGLPEGLGLMEDLSSSLSAIAWVLLSLERY